MNPKADTVERWGIFELVLKGPSSGNPFMDVTIDAQFAHQDRQVEVSGFCDGNGVYLVRFMPDVPGVWNYVTRSNVPELDGQQGEFTCVEALDGVHGPVSVHNTHHFPMRMVHRIIISAQLATPGHIRAMPWRNRP